jgi:hypothetical protein
VLAKKPPSRSYPHGLGNNFNILVGLLVAGGTGPQDRQTDSEPQGHADTESDPEVSEHRLEQSDEVVADVTPWLGLGIGPDPRPEAPERAERAAGSEHEFPKLAQ